jgi:hypothetical protein
MSIGVEKLRMMSRDQQIRLLHNAMRCSKHPGCIKKCEAIKLFGGLESLWRDETYEKLNEKADVSGLILLETPQCGLLRTMGYRVGAEHEEEWLRREILKWVLLHEIPFVHSVGYMRQWGAPGSSTRERKLNNVLMGFIEGTWRRTSYGQALKHWHEDKRFVQEACQHKPQNRSDSISCWQSCKRLGKVAGRLPRH